MVIAGKFNINFAVASLSRFASAPRQGHLEMARRIIGYLWKFQKQGYIINPKVLNIDPDYDNVSIAESDKIVQKYNK